MYFPLPFSFSEQELPTELSLWLSLEGLKPGLSGESVTGTEGHRSAPLNLAVTGVLSGRSVCGKVSSFLSSADHWTS